MKFRYTIMYVDDVSATIDFYGRAFGIEKQMVHESGDYGELNTGDTILSFSSKSLMSQLGKNPGACDPGAPTFEIAFETEDVPKSLARAIDAGAKLIQDCETMPWGQITSYVQDINGFLIEICTAVSGS